MDVAPVRQRPGRHRFECQRREQPALEFVVIEPSGPGQVMADHGRPTQVFAQTVERLITFFLVDAVLNASNGGRYLTKMSAVESAPLLTSTVKVLYSQIRPSRRSKYSGPPRAWPEGS
jgi:hypothetical protein